MCVCVCVCVCVCSHYAHEGRNLAAGEGIPVTGASFILVPSGAFFLPGDGRWSRRRRKERKRRRVSLDLNSLARTENGIEIIYCLCGYYYYYYCYYYYYYYYCYYCYV